MSDEEMSTGYDRNDPEVRLGRALEHLQITLSVEMQRLREKRGLNQTQLGEKMGINQPAVSKLENANVKSDVESVLRYFHALDADLVLGFLDDSEFVPVSEAAEKWWKETSPTKAETHWKRHPDKNLAQFLTGSVEIKRDTLSGKVAPEESADSDDEPRKKKHYKMSA